MSDLKSQRTTLRRRAHLAVHDRQVINGILDEAFVAHVGLIADDGFPIVLPMAFGREGGTLYLHGSAANHLLRQGKKEGVELCVTVTLVHGLVLAKAAFNQCVNYRSVVLLGSAVEVKDLAEKERGLNLLVDHVIPGRSGDIRPATELELRATMLLALPIDEASAKVRTGWPIDEPEDAELAVWAGVIPLRTVALPAVPAPDLIDGVIAPDYAMSYTRRGWPHPEAPL
jgi:nitroimidazol reductase NimA-like FMN-containing flavoprotein (pyridoxamine 5'-phosphate oxidase superfamily)